MFLYLFPVYTINKSGLKKFGFEYQGGQLSFFYIRSKGPSQVISYKTNDNQIQNIVKENSPIKI